MNKVSAVGMEQFRSFLQNTFGIRHDDGRVDILWDVLQERRLATGIASETEYLDHLEHSHDEQEVVVRRITISETYFFRIPEQFQAFEKTVLPELMRNRQIRKIRILSCGCASGEEPYTLAMLIAERRHEYAGWSFEITGIDLNTASLEIARRGSYSNWSLRSTSDHFRRQYFERKGRHYLLHPEIRQMVAFRQHNLFQARLQSEFDVIFFRNVLIYFSPEAARKVIGQMEAMLADKGYLFLGSAETLRGISDSFEILHTDDAFYYQLGGPQTRGRPLTPVSRKLFPVAPPTGPADAEPETSWFDDIQRSAGRIEQLLQKRPTLWLTPAPLSRDIPVTRTPAPEHHNADAEELTLAVVLRLNEGNVNSAEQTCQLLLERGGMDASAHYLMALCREQRGDIAGAIEQDEIASYLDPTFSMPQLHKGMLACRQGQPEAGCRSLEKSLELLRTEDFTRILLLGGGFHRQSLMNMCERELERCRRMRA